MDKIQYPSFDSEFVVQGPEKTSNFQVGDEASGKFLQVKTKQERNFMVQKLTSHYYITMWRNECDL